MVKLKVKNGQRGKDNAETWKNMPHDVPLTGETMYGVCSADRVSKTKKPDLSARFVFGYRIGFRKTTR